jgi:hypothetical protein
LKAFEGFRGNLNQFFSFFSCGSCSKWFQTRKSISINNPYVAIVCAILPDWFFRCTQAMCGIDDGLYDIFLITCSDPTLADLHEMGATTWKCLQQNIRIPQRAKGVHSTKGAKELFEGFMCCSVLDIIIQLFLNFFGVNLIIRWY